MKWLFLACLMACSGTEPNPTLTPTYQLNPRDQVNESDLGPECVLVYRWGEIDYTIWQFECQGKEVWTATCNNDTAPGCTPPVLPDDVDYQR